MRLLVSRNVIRVTTGRQVTNPVKTYSYGPAGAVDNPVQTAILKGRK